MAIANQQSAGKVFLAVAGNVGVGKSSLTRLLADQMGWHPFFEAVEDNPYLADFYQDMKRWSFHSQIFFLSRRLRHHHELLLSPHSVIQDRTVYEDAEVFAANLFRQGLMEERDYRVYRDLYEALALFLPPPDLIIYLKASVPVLLERIAMRGRDFERNISFEYLEQLNRLYDIWVAGFHLCPILVVTADEMDFVRHHDHLYSIADQVFERLGMLRATHAG